MTDVSIYGLWKRIKIDFPGHKTKESKWNKKISIQSENYWRIMFMLRESDRMTFCYTQLFAWFIVGLYLGKGLISLVYTIIFICMCATCFLCFVSRVRSENLRYIFYWNGCALISVSIKCNLPRALIKVVIISQQQPYMFDGFEFYFLPPQQSHL